MLRRTLVVACLFFFLSAIAIEQQPAAEPLSKNLNKDAERWVEKTLRGMSTEEKVGQLIMVRAFAEFQNSQSPGYLDLRDALQKYHLGSVLLTVRSNGAIIYRNQPYEAAMATNQLQRDSKLPLLVAADFERGLAMRLFATPEFPHPMAFAATADPAANVERFAEIVARESRAIGVHWNFFPVADINTNPENPIINIRSFGEDPKQVSELVQAYIRGAHAGGTLATAKHFPGHGDTDRDTHISMARVNASLEHLQQVEFAPFRAAIAGGVDSVMVAHVTVPAIEPEANRVASVSRKVVHNVLQQQLGFDGLTVTDAMEMQALASLYGNTPEDLGRTAVEAILAGNDMILLPVNLDAAYNGLLAAAKNGTLPKEELDARVRKILRAKAALGLQKTRTVDIGKLRDQVGRPEDLLFAQQVADAAVTLAKSDSRALDLLRQARVMGGTSLPPVPYQQTGRLSEQGVFAMIALDDMRSDWGRTFERELKARVPSATVIYVDSRNAGAMMEAVTDATLRAKAVIIGGFAAPLSGVVIRTEEGLKGATSLQVDVSGVINRVLAIAPDKTTFVALGNPYLGEKYSPKTYVCTFSNAPTGETAAVKALFDEIKMTGKLPVTIPGIAERGAGQAAAH